MHARRQFIVLAPGTLIAAAIVAAMLLLPRSGPAAAEGIDAGVSRACAITAGGDVQCWDSSRYGQLGDGTSRIHLRAGAVDVSGLASGFTPIAAGASQTCALAITGAVECWGDSSYGALGDGRRTGRTIPAHASGLSRGMAAVSLGGNHPCALSTGGGMKCRGIDAAGQVGAVVPSSCITLFCSNTPLDVASLTSGVGQITGGAVAGQGSGSINGTVTDEDTGAPLLDICVVALDDSFNFFEGGLTDAAGGYSVGGLPAGDYKVFFYDCGDVTTYLSEWYDDKPDFDSADLVAVTVESKTSGIDAALAVGGSINGTVTDEDTGATLSDICVFVTDSIFFFGLGFTDAAGGYSVGGLPAGDYMVGFIDCRDATTYLTEWYDDKPDVDSADPVAVIAQSKTSGIDAALTVGGSINGTVTDEDTGAPISDICVGVNDPSSDFGGFGYADADGSYSVGGLPAGDYTVGFFACGDATILSARVVRRQTGRRVRRPGGGDRGVQDVRGRRGADGWGLDQRYGD